MLHHAVNARRIVAAFVTAILFGAGLTVGLATPASAAPPASSFDPGLIISDAVMFDYGAMSEGDIQAFLDLKITACSATASQPCLNAYTADTHDVAPVANRCDGGITGASAVPASRIIYEVAIACRVNPKVLLVTLQKEQGLVTATSPTATKYRIAMGYGCPDTAACDSTYYGFFNQVYQAAYAFNKYTKSPDQYTAYQPGQRTIGYNPKSSCGSATVTIKSKATGALYFYTPYVPNAAALANLYGTGDSCSSYGNRNFWRYFNDWFGSPVGGSFIIDTDDDHTYVLINGARWEIPPSRLALLSTLAPLGKSGRVSAAYADSFPFAGTFGNLVIDSTGALFLLDRSRKLSFADCTQAGDFGYPCATAVPMPDDMLAYFPTQGSMGTFVTTTAGAWFVLGGGLRREVLDVASAIQGNVALPPASAVLLDDTLASVRYAAPVVRPGALVSMRDSASYYFVTSIGAYQLTKKLIDDLRLTSRLGPVAGALDQGSINLLPGQVAVNGLFTEATTGATFAMTKNGKASVTNPAKLGGSYPYVDAEFSALLPPSGETITAPTFLKDLSSGVKFLVTDKKRRPAATNASVRALAAKFKVPTTSTSLSGETIATIGKAYLAPATVVKASAKAKELWFIDGASKKRPVTKEQAKELTGSTKAKVVPKSTIDGFATVKGAAKPGVKAGGIYYLADGGILRIVSAADAKRYGSKFGFGSYDLTTIAALDKGVDIGRVIKAGSKYYEVKNGKKVRISASTANTIAASTGKKTQAVSSYFASQLVTK